MNIPKPNDILHEKNVRKKTEWYTYVYQKEIHYEGKGMCAGETGILGVK